MPLSDIKVLLLNVNRSGWHSGNMIYDMMAIQRACDTKIYGPGWPNYEHTNINEIINQLYGSDRPDVIYSYFTENETVRDCYMQHYNIPSELKSFHHGLKDIKSTLKIFALSDFWARNKQQFEKDLIGSTFQYCFACFAPPYANPKDFYSFFNDEIRKEIEFIGYPRCVDEECYYDYELPKKYDVISLGAMGRFYPLRTNVHKTLTQHADEFNINYHNYSHCGFDFQHSSFVREEYAQAINEAKMLVSCGGRYHVVMNKVFEAMGCGTVYVGEKPWGAKELHMKDGFNYIAITKNDFVSKIQYYLNRPNDLKTIYDNAKATFKQYHNIDARSKDFVKLLEGII